MRVRDAVAGDAEGIARIYNDAVLTTTAILNEGAVDAENRIGWMEMRRGQGYPVLVAEHEGRVIGYASFGDWRPFDGFRATVEHSVYVAAEARGQGVARALMTELTERARGCGKHVMVAAVTSENEASLRLHRALGFREAAVLTEVGQKFGRWLDLVFLELRLDDRAQPEQRKA
ncbi:N-acetyltransferase [Cereibacter changlensis]|uniref:N-acetyltransferase n=2 Tax=Cereibacter changlensis TaxID=402884 RepID=A0A4U0YZI1_9RHOB|nr:GNAT family N-acetyltransferase [Cereibacter changlensis]TKA98322.1 N-acetyltransferase [Cereibacter changlensis]